MARVRSLNKSCWFHLLSTVAWVPLTVAIVLFDLENAVWVVIALSVYANVKTDWGNFHAARAAQEAKSD